MPVSALPGENRTQYYFFIQRGMITQST